jgi:membrane peptidoglycan carboxypeptidase
VLAYKSIAIPPPNQAALAQTTIVYYSNGTDEIGRLSTQNRQDVKLSQIPVPVRNAVLAAEDHTFYTNSGIDPKSIIRAAWADVRGNSLQGGSTISQQYVKNVYDQRDRSYKRKFNEVFLAVKINQQIDKDQILERYLNTIYLGRGAYGIQAASQAYFHENVGQLTVSQGAFLAGVINAPSLADPRGGADQKARAERRWGVVLDAMVQEKWLDAGTRQTLTFPKTIVPAAQTSLKGQNAYLMEMAKAEAAQDLGVTEDTLNTGGYKIVTTFNKRLVAAGVKAVKDKLPKDHPKGIRVGMASIDPTTGAVRAIYGGTSIKTQENQATKDKAQGGSTFKAFGLIAALESGVSLKTQYSSASPIKVAGHTVNNFEDEEFTGQSGYIDLVKATQESVNTVFVQLNHDVGPPKTQAAAYAAGIPKEGTDLDGNLVNVLGSASVHPIDLASAYGTFAAQGVRKPYYVIQKISYVGTGKQIPLPARAKGKRVFDADAVADLTYALQHVVDNGTGSYARQLGRPVAGKTGTSSHSKSAWFVGYTPQLVTAVAIHQVGKDKKKIVGISGFGGVSNVTGGTFPTEIWTEYMEAAVKGTKVIQFPPATFGGEITNAAPTPTFTPTTAPPTDSPQPTATDNPQPTFTTEDPQPTETDNPQPTDTSINGPDPNPDPTQSRPTSTRTLSPGNNEDP